MSTTHSKMDSKPALWKIIYLSSLVPFFIMLPETAVPHLSVFFKLQVSSAEWVVSICCLAYGLGALLYGPFANCLGKKKTLILFFMIGLVGVLCNLVSFSLHSFMLLLIGRALTGFGVGSGLVLGMVILNEAYEPQRARVLYSWVVPFFTFAPALALACGGFLLKNLGVFSLFVVLLLLVLIGIGVIISFSISDSKPLQASQPVKIIRSYWYEIYSWPFVRLTIILSVSMSSIYIFNGISTLIAIHDAGISPTSYGVYAMIPSLGLFVGAYLSTVMNRSIQPMTIVRCGILLLLITALVMIALLVLASFSIWFLLIPAIALFIAAALVIPNISMLLLSQATNAAVASSVFNATGLLVASLVLSVASGLLSVGPMLLPIALLLLVVISMLMCVFQVRRS